MPLCFATVGRVVLCFFANDDAEKRQASFDACRFCPFSRGSYRRRTRARPPVGVSFRRFSSFSAWRAPARLRLKSQKPHENSSPTGAVQFCRSRNAARQGKSRGSYWRMAKGHDAVWAYFLPSMECRAYNALQNTCVPLSIDGMP